MTATSSIPPQVIQVAAAVVSRCDRRHPADQLLRDELRQRRGLDPGMAGRISRLVFDYYRWHGWLDPSARMPDRLQLAAALSRRFREAPASFSNADLMARAVPEWTREHVAVTAAWVKALQAEPRMWLRARAGTGAAIAARLQHCRIAGPGRLSDTMEYHGRDDLFTRKEFHEGAFEIQDIASQWVGWLCDPQAGQTWWDACAGEGGKTLQLSGLMANRGLIWASDRADWRLQHLKRRAARAVVFNYRMAPWDGGVKLPTRTRFDGVLLDAPCSGLGTWHRNPHARWHTTPEDVRELADLQLRLLKHAAPAVKPGGKLVYAVCTLTHAETSEAAAAFEAACPEFVPLPLADPLAPGASPTFPLWLWPQASGGNGMFVAVWRRSPSAPAAGQKPLQE